MSNANKDDSLVGQDIAVYLDGGWSLVGTVKKSDDNRIFIKNDEELFMVYRNKISAVCLNFDIKKRKPTRAKSASERPEDEPSDWPGERIGGHPEGVLSLPLDMLTEEAESSFKDNDFSIQFSKSELFVKNEGPDDTKK